VSPHEIKRGSEAPTLANPPRVGPKTPANPKPTGWANGGPGGTDPWRGAWGMCPLSDLTPCPLPCEGRGKIWRGSPHEWDPKTLANPQPTRVGKGVQGAQAPWQGVWGMCPQRIKIRGELPPFTAPPRVGPKTPANPQPTGVGKGVQGAQPPGGGRGGCALKNQKRGRVAHSYQPRHEWDPKRWQTLSPRGWANGRLTVLGCSCRAKLTSGKIQGEISLRG